MPHVNQERLEALTAEIRRRSPDIDATEVEAMMQDIDAAGLLTLPTVEETVNQIEAWLKAKADAAMTALNAEPQPTDDGRYRVVIDIETDAAHLAPETLHLINAHMVLHSAAHLTININRPEPPAHGTKRLPVVDEDLDDEFDDLDDDEIVSAGTCRNCGSALNSEEADYQDGFCASCWNAEPDDLNAIWEDDEVSA